MQLTEGTLVFSFPEEVEAIKFDNTEFFKNSYQKQPSGKGVDFLISNNSKLILMEIKDCAGEEQNNVWRLSPDNKALDKAPKGLDISNRDSLDIEIAKKIASTIACLTGAATCSKKGADLLTDWYSKLNAKKIFTGKLSLEVVLVLEGHFSHFMKTQTDSLTKSRLKNSLSRKLSWLNCNIRVIDAADCPTTWCKITRMTPSENIGIETE